MARLIGKEVLKDYLLRIPLFAELPDQELAVLVQDARPQMFRKGARVFEEGSPADCCFVLTAGKARVVLSGETGSEILLHIVNHSTYHRGYVAQMFYQVPARPPTTDLPVFLRERR